ncbi:MAG: dephospho-CoA kinase [Pseudomonadota bacterium]
MKGKPYLVGLTGSIGMGKSTTGKMFANAGVPIWDADAAVHRLYEKNGAAVPEISKLCPEATGTGSVDRDILSKWIAVSPERLSAIEAIVHPLVAADRLNFIAASDAPILLFDIPLLFETGTDRLMDATVVVTTDSSIQRQRVLAREGMTPERLDAILDRQLPDSEKRARADYVIHTGTLEAARASVQAVLRDIGDRAHARNRAGYGNDGI